MKYPFRYNFIGPLRVYSIIYKPDNHLIFDLFGKLITWSLVNLAVLYCFRDARAPKMGHLTHRFTIIMVIL